MTDRPDRGQDGAAERWAGRDRHRCHRRGRLRPGWRQRQPRRYRLRPGATLRPGLVGPEGLRVLGCRPARTGGRFRPRRRQRQSCGSRVRRRAFPRRGFTGRQGVCVFRLRPARTGGGLQPARGQCQPVGDRFCRRAVLCRRCGPCPRIRLRECRTAHGAERFSKSPCTVIAYPRAALPGPSCQCEWRCADSGYNDPSPCRRLPRTPS